MASNVDTDKIVLVRQKSDPKSRLLKSLRTKIRNLRRKFGSGFDGPSSFDAFLKRERPALIKRDAVQCIELRHTGGNRWE